MNSMHYVGLDIHKKSISSCVRQADGTIVQESTIAASHQALDRWMEQLPQPWVAGMEATMFTGWIYDHLNSRGAIAKVGHPAMLKAIGAGKAKQKTPKRLLHELDSTRNGKWHPRTDSL
jgi:hypothetical protein